MIYVSFCRAVSNLIVKTSFKEQKEMHRERQRQREREKDESRSMGRRQINK